MSCTQGSLFDRTGQLLCLCSKRPTKKIEVDEKTKCIFRHDKPMTVTRKILSIMSYWVNFRFGPN